MKMDRAAWVCLFLFALSGTVQAQTAPVKGLSLRLIEKGFEKPVYFTHDPAGRDFVVEQVGRIRLMVNGRAEAKAYLDITDRVFEQGECGFLSIAFHPKFAENGRFFVNYTTRPVKKITTIISEFKADPKANTVDPQTEKVILKIDQPYSNHNGGQIKFGPDGMLYIGMGDGGSGGDPQNRAQNMQDLLGKILRIDVDSGGEYQVPKDNPFVGDKAYRPEIWASGLRNPWRFTFDRETGICYTGDVGQGKYEEVDVIVKGGNYGWRIREGAHTFKPDDRNKAELIDPIAEYGRNLGQSITGGYVYRGKAIPALQGVYLYADFQSGRFWGLKYEDGKVTWNAELEATLSDRDRSRVNVSTFGENQQGEMFVCDHGRGLLYQIVNVK